MEIPEGMLRDTLVERIDEQIQRVTQIPRHLQIYPGHIPNAHLTTQSSNNFFKVQAQFEHLCIEVRLMNQFEDMDRDTSASTSAFPYQDENESANSQDLAPAAPDDLANYTSAKIRDGWGSYFDI